MDKVFQFLAIFVACVSCSRPFEECQSENDLLIGKWKVEKLWIKFLSSGCGDVPIGKVPEGSLHEKFTLILNKDNTFILSDGVGQNNFAGIFRCSNDSILLSLKRNIFLIFKVDSLLDNRLYLYLERAQFYSIENDSFLLFRGQDVNIQLRRN
ncbi:hypothetical protein [Sporocytophaga myxococcoides]|uniref:hypothetical protein n=1 Tax=Sporocytophaga myxococcoides TaxID=153721 RepID=UPI0003F65A1F|nr:hypothetical protein [Sporocytophaga myxococcoides]